MKKTIYLLSFVLLACCVNNAFCQKQDLPGVRSHRDLVYAKHGDQEMKLDLYVPETGDGPFPVVIWIHGGGWIAGDKNDCAFLNAGYCQKGYAAASLSYRFSNVAPFPAQLEDVKAAIRWLRAHADQYKLDKEHFGVWGGSAGGHLSCLLGVTGRTKQFDVGLFLDESSEVQAVCNFFGPTDLSRNHEGLDPNADLTKAVEKMIADLLGGPISEKAELARQASSVTYVDENAAPFLHVHGTLDPLVPVEQAEILHDKLRGHNVPSRLFLIPRGNHGGAEFISPNMLEEIRLFFEKHLKTPTEK